MRPFVFPLRVCRALALYAAIAPISVSLAADSPSDAGTETTAAATAGSVLVREFRFEGNEAIPTQTLEKAVSSYTGRRLNSADIDQARQAVTHCYVDRGYINSGAVFKDYDASKGSVSFRIVEGKLTRVNVKGNRWLRTSFLESRAFRGAGTPLNTCRLNDGLEGLRSDPNAQSVTADLQPGAAPGEAVLALDIKDRQPFRLALQFDNNRPASVGAEEILLDVADVNLTGYGDPLEVTYGIARKTPGGFGLSGKDNIDVGYTRPITSAGTTVTLHYLRGDYSVMEEPFNPLNIDSQERSYSISLRQTLYHSATRDAAVGLAAEREESQTFLLGMPFTLSPGDVNGEEKLSVLRFFQEYTQQSSNAIFAARSIFSFGLNAFGATNDGTDRNGQFFSWRPQLQYVQKLFKTDALMILRVSAQVASGPLQALEQFSIGGSRSVRGYRENQLVRDEGVFESVEFRIPIISRKVGDPIVQVAPFFDCGTGSDLESPSTPTQTIYSTGVGVLLTPSHFAYLELYYGYKFQHVPVAERNLQDDGIHFLVRLNAF